MTEHEVRRLAFWVALIEGPAKQPLVDQDNEGRWYLTVNGIGPIYYLWEYPLYQEALKKRRW